MTAARAHELLRTQGATVAVAESLTGGLLGAELTAVPGSSLTFRGGVIAYVPDVKTSLLGVPADVLADIGAVSDTTAIAMATGVRRLLDSTYGLALTGVAGPEEQEGKPAGTVHAGVAGPRGERSVPLHFDGDRPQIRRLATRAAIELLCAELS